MSAFLSAKFPRRLLLLGLLFWLAGCGPPQEQFWPVSGQVMLDAKPLQTGTVAFRPDAARGNTSLHHTIGQIDTQGRYVLVTTNRQGAPQGWYKVLVFADENIQPGAAVHPVLPRWLVPAQYTNEKTTPLSVEVVATPSLGVYDLKLKK